MSINTIGDIMNSETIKPISNNQVTVIIGGGKGDEGKGGDALNLASKGNYEEIFGLIGGPNAGHTAIDDEGKKFVGHNLPGSALTGKDVFLGQGKYINVEGLFEEIKELNKLGVNPKIRISYSAHCLFTSFHGKLDGAIEEAKKENGNDVGTTKSGMGPGVATRGLRNGITIGKLLEISKEDLKISIKELIEPFNPKFIPEKDNIEPEILKHQFILKSLINDGNIEIVEDTYGRDKYQEGKKIIIEGAQSPSLGMFGGDYPYNTSTDTSFMGILSSVQIIPVIGRVGEIIVGKLFPSAVGNHAFLERISHVFQELLEKEKKFGAETGEYGATTKRPRMVGFPSPALLGEHIKHDPYVIAVSLRKLDVMEQFQKILGFNELPIVTSYEKNGKPIITNINYDPREVVDIYKNTIDEIVGNDRGINLPFILGFGPKPNQSRILTR